MITEAARKLKGLNIELKLNILEGKKPRRSTILAMCQKVLREYGHDVYIDGENHRLLIKYNDKAII